MLKCSASNSRLVGVGDWLKAAKAAVHGAPLYVGVNNTRTSGRDRE